MRPAIHGHSQSRGGLPSRTYVSWIGMRQRCLNPRAVAYGLYGGRGITVCERRDDFRNFLADMGERPEGTSIDRFPDMNGNYEPGNCRWATPIEQGNNTRANVRVNIDGDTRTLIQWTRASGIKPKTVDARRNLGWDIERAVTEPTAMPPDLSGERHGSLVVIGKAPPVRGRQARWVVRCDCGREYTLTTYKVRHTTRCRRCEIRLGERPEIVLASGKTLRDLERETGIPRGTLYLRLLRGWPEGRIGTPIAATRKRGWEKRREREARL